MLALLASWRERSFGTRAGAMLLYGLLTFGLIYYLGTVLFANPLVFRIFELCWFLHIVFICNKLQSTQRELMILALLALSPGIASNLMLALTPV